MSAQQPSDETKAADTARSHAAQEERAARKAAKRAQMQQAQAQPAQQQQSSQSGSSEASTEKKQRASPDPSNDAPSKEIKASDAARSQSKQQQRAARKEEKRAQMEQARQARQATAAAAPTGASAPENDASSSVSNESKSTDAPQAEEQQQKQSTAPLQRRKSARKATFETIMEEHKESDSSAAAPLPSTRNQTQRRVSHAPPPIDLSATRRAVPQPQPPPPAAQASARPHLPRLLRRAESERIMAEFHQRVSSKVDPFANVQLWMAAFMGAASQLFFFALAHVWQPTHRGAAFVFNALTLRFLPTMLGGGGMGSSVSSGILSVVVGALVGSALWSLIVHVLLPIWRFHLKRRSVWPLSCESIRLSDARWAPHLAAWARGIDANNTDAACADEWGSINGAPALRLMAAYQDDPAFATKQNAHFICLRYFPTPPPKAYTSWFDYFRRRRASPSPPVATPSALASPSRALQTPALTPYPDMASLRTPALRTPFVPAGSTAAADVAPAEEAVDDTVALVFLTVLPNYNLRPYLPWGFSSLLSFAMGVYRKIRHHPPPPPPPTTSESESASAHAPSIWSLSMSLGIIGFQFPFRSGVFFTRRLSFYEPYAKAFAKPAGADKSNGNNNNGSNIAHMSSEEREARTARYALVLQVLTEWNLSRRLSQRVDLLLHATPSNSASTAAARRLHLLPISVPPSYIADMRSWGGGKWSAYTASLRKEGKRVREAPFEKAGGTASFSADPELASTAVNMWRAVANKQAETGGSHPTLLQPTETWIRALMQPLDDSSNTGSSAPVAELLQLRVPAGLAATSLVCEFGSSLLTSDVAGFDYPLLARVEQETGTKVHLYSNKLAHVLRRAMEHRVAFVDFGPTTGEPKRQIGCQTVPLYGAAICAQVHMLWLARAAASVVVLNQQLPQLVASVSSTLKRGMQRVRSGTLLQRLSLVNGNASSPRSSPSAPKSSVADVKEKARDIAAAVDVSVAAPFKPRMTDSADSTRASAKEEREKKDADAARSQQQQQERAARKEAKRKQMMQAQSKQQQGEQSAAEQNKSDKDGVHAPLPHSEQQTRAQQQPVSPSSATKAADAARSQQKQQERAARKASKRAQMQQAQSQTSQQHSSQAASSEPQSDAASEKKQRASPNPPVTEASSEEIKASDAARSQSKQQERAARKEEKRAQMEQAQQVKKATAAAPKKAAPVGFALSSDSSSMPRADGEAQQSSEAAPPSATSPTPRAHSSRDAEEKCCEDQKEMMQQQTRKLPATDWRALRAELQR